MACSTFCHNVSMRANRAPVACAHDDDSSSTLPSATTAGSVAEGCEAMPSTCNSSAWCARFANSRPLSQQGLHLASANDRQTRVRTIAPVSRAAVDHPSRHAANPGDEPLTQGWQGKSAQSEKLGDVVSCSCPRDCARAEYGKVVVRGLTGCCCC